MTIPKLRDPTLTLCTIETPLGPMVGISDHSFLHALQFQHCPYTNSYYPQDLHKHRHTASSTESSPALPYPLVSIQNEIHMYFKRKIQSFNTPFVLHKKTFTRDVFHLASLIPYGQTTSYANIAHTFQKQKLYRAVARSLASNPLLLLIPCHRIIRNDKTLGGYKGQTWRKEWLLNFERSNE